MFSSIQFNKLLGVKHNLQSLKTGEYDPTSLASKYSPVLDASHDMSKLTLHKKYLMDYKFIVGFLNFNLFLL